MKRARFTQPLVTLNDVYDPRLLCQNRWVVMHTCCVYTLNLKLLTFYRGGICFFETIKLGTLNLCCWMSNTLKCVLQNNNWGLTGRFSMILQMYRIKWIDMGVRIFIAKNNNQGCVFPLLENYICLSLTNNLWWM